MLAIYSLTCPAPSAYWGRTGLCCIQVTAQRIRLTLPHVNRTHIANHMKRVQGDKSPWRSLGRRLCRFHLTRPDSKVCAHRGDRAATRLDRSAAVRPPPIDVGQVSVAPECPSPRKTHPHRESNEESPESRRLFGAVWGAAAVRLPPFAPAFSPRKAFQSQCGYAKAHKSRAADSVPRPPSGSPPENTQSRSKPTKPDNHTTSENALLAIPTHGGIGTQHFASRPVWRYSANSRRDRTQDIPRETHNRREPNAIARISHGLYAF